MVYIYIMCIYKCLCECTHMRTHTAYTCVRVRNHTDDKKRIGARALRHT
jgi:hypothetical protein